MDSDPRGARGPSEGTAARASAPGRRLSVCCSDHLMGRFKLFSRKLQLKTTLDFLSTADLSQRPPSTAQRMGMSLEGQTTAKES